MHSKSQQFVFHTPNLTTTADANGFASFPTSNSHYSDLTTDANFVRYISSLQRFPEPLELCGGGSLKGLGDLLKLEI